MVVEAAGMVLTTKAVLLEGVVDAPALTPKPNPISVRILQNYSAASGATGAHRQKIGVNGLLPCSALAGMADS